MESDLPITTPSLKRLNITDAVEEEEEEEEDIFHRKSLPEPVIAYILSFLPTKDAIRTSILSKRWVRRWTSITKLSFRDDSQRCDDFMLRSKRIKNFASFVNRTILLTDSLTIDHFSLFLSNLYDWTLLNSWFSNIFNRRVRNLQIHSFFQLSFSVLTSHSLFKNFTLVEELELLTDSSSFINVPMSVEELKLITDYLVNSVNVPAPIKSIRFENLKILKLRGINFTTDSPTSPRCIDLRFPLLTKFEAKNCAWFLDATLVMVIAPLLDSILIEHYCYVPYRYNKSLIVFPSTMHLKEFSYCGYDISQNILVESPESPCHASAKIILHESKSYVSYMSDIHVAALLTQFSHAKSIKFESSKVLYLNQMLPEKICVFPMLTDFEVGLVSVDILLALLRKTPVLKTLVLKRIRSFAEELLSSAVVPDCLASLHVVKFEEVNGDDHDLVLAQFFVENGMILERMSFSLASQILNKDEVMEEFKQKFSSFCNFIPVVVEFSCGKIILHMNRNYESSSGFHVLNQFSHAKSIKFEGSKVLKQPHKLCEFPLLTHLEVGLVSVDILLVFLQKTPVLKTLVLKGIRKFAEELLSSAVVPYCLARLHVVKFEEVNGDDHELFLANFFMDNGIFLEKMCFSLANRVLYKDEVMEEIKKKLHSFHNFSVEFSY